MWEKLPYRDAVLTWLNDLQILVSEHFLVLDSAKQIAMLVAIFVAGQLFKGKIHHGVEAIRLPKAISRYEIKLKETLRPIAQPVVLIILLWFCVFIMQSLEGRI